MSHGDHRGSEEPTDLSSTDSSQDLPAAAEYAERHELPSNVVYYHGETTREWIRHDGSLDVEVMR
jgi:hypothetical protein